MNSHGSEFIFFSDPQLILSRLIGSVARRWPTRCNRLHRSITYPTAASITSRNYLYSIMAAVTAEELGCESVAIFARNRGLHQSASTERSHSDPYRQRLRTNTVSPSCAVSTGLRRRTTPPPGTLCVISADRHRFNEQLSREDVMCVSIKSRASASRATHTRLLLSCEYPRC